MWKSTFTEEQIETTWHRSATGKGLRRLVAAWYLCAFGAPASVSCAGSIDDPELQPRPLSSAERAAVEAVAWYLDGGPPAIWEHLSDRAFLHHLGREEALREIEARLGPAAGSSWTLDMAIEPENPLVFFAVQFASGIDDTIAFEMLEEDGSWRIASIRSSVEPLPPASTDRRATPSAAPTPTSAVLLALVAGTGFVLWRLRARHRAAAALAVFAFFFAWSCFRRPLSGPQLRLGVLLPLRQAIALGEPEATVDAAAAAQIPRDAEAARTVWLAQLRLAQGQPRAAAQLLDSLANSSQIPMALLLRARVALRLLHAERSAAAFDEVLGVGLDTELLRLESRTAKALIEAAINPVDWASEDLARAGARQARVWYDLAAHRLFDGDDEEAFRLFRTAWVLSPLTREELFAEPGTALQITRRAGFELAALEEPEEPVVEVPRPVASISLPSSGSAASCGQALELSVRQAVLRVPMGSLIAPPGTRAESATQRASRHRQQALQDLDALRSATQNRSQPAILERVRRTGAALASEGRWEDLRQLTAPWRDATPMPVAVGRLQALALAQLGDSHTATAITTALALQEVRSKRPSPGVLLDLAGLMAAERHYDTAAQLIAKADRQVRLPQNTPRYELLRLDAGLHREGEVFLSTHFEIRHPPGTSKSAIRQISLLLEQERLRLSKWVPLVDGPPIRVHVYPEDSFRRIFGHLILGVYDGTVRVPAPGASGLSTELLSTISHELCHALLDRATAGRVPKWFNEGLAQHIEPSDDPLWNPYRSQTETARCLAFPNVEPVLAGFTEPVLVRLAYAQALMAIKFISIRGGGAAAIRRLEQAFARGLSTEEALLEVTGERLADFDRQLRTWAERSMAMPAAGLDVYDRRAPASSQRESEAPRPTEGPRIETAAMRRARVQKVVAWHRTYARRIEPVKAMWQSVRDALIGHGPLPRDTCRAMASALQDFDSWQRPPDSAIQDALGVLVHNYRDAAVRCFDGDRAKTAALVYPIERSELALAKVLKEYDLAP